VARAGTNSDARPLAVFDVDGVVADVRHRVHHIEDRRRDWEAFFAAADRDPLLPEGAALVADLGRAHEIVWLTGRPEWLRETTADWLAGHGLPDGELYLRPYGDYRPAPRYKLDVLRSLSARRIAAVIDDDDEVVQAALGAGFPAVLADWVPRTAALRQAQDRDGRT
jgi:phosphoglycolate phosphatase-like HAD superfamily hydrolase